MPSEPISWVNLSGLVQPVYRVEYTDGQKVEEKQSNKFSRFLFPKGYSQEIREADFTHRGFPLGFEYVIACYSDYGTSFYEKWCAAKIDSNRMVKFEFKGKVQEGGKEFYLYELPDLDNESK